MRFGKCRRRRWHSRTRCSSGSYALTRSAIEGRGSGSVVVAPCRVEVDGPDSQQPLAQRLVGVDVLYAVDARLLHALGQQAATDVEPLRGDQVSRRHALEEAERENGGDQRGAGQYAEHEAREQPDDDRDRQRSADAADVEGQQRPPRRVPLEHDLFAGMQVHGRIFAPAGVIDIIREG
jgi:hypothetical protein